jgi:hypothetical protein
MIGLKACSSSRINPSFTKWANVPYRWKGPDEIQEVITNYFRIFIFYHFSSFLLSPFCSSRFLPNSDKCYVKTMKVTPLSLRWQLPTPSHHLQKCMKLHVSIEAVWEWRYAHGSKPSPTTAINSFSTTPLNLANGVPSDGQSLLAKQIYVKKWCRGNN